MDENIQINYIYMMQVASVLSIEHNFEEQLIREYSSFLKEEMWFFNAEDPNFQLIRVTIRPQSVFEQDRDRVEHVITGISYLKEIEDLSFLDIHISREDFSSTKEEYHHLNLYTRGFAEGYDVSKIYPKLYTCLQYVDDEQIPDEIHALSEKLNEAHARRNKKTSLFKQGHPLVTYGIIALCAIMYLITVFMGRKYTSSAVLVFLGADYKTFTLGLKEFWRLFTTAFLHGGFLHFFTNMYSLYILGSYIEKRLGPLSLIGALIISILTSSLTQGLLSANTITIGISGGIYALMVIFIMDMYRLKLISLRSFLPVIIINVMINFLDTTAWIAHIGGLISGIVLYYFFFSEDKIGLGVLIGVMLLSLFYKYATMKIISPFYAGTDMEIVKMFDDLNLKEYALNLARRLSDVYVKYGGGKW